MEFKLGIWFIGTLVIRSCFYS